MPDSKSKHFYQPTHFKIPNDKLKNLMLIPMEHPLKSEVFRAILVETKGVTSKMKRCIVLVILACFLFASIGIAEDSEKFVFRNGITWGMSPEEVQACEEASLFADEDSKDKYFSYGVDASKYKAVLTLHFKNEQLFMIVYSFQDDWSQTYKVIDYLYEALSLKYGESANTTFEAVDDVNRFLYGESPLLLPKSRPEGRIYKFTNVDMTDIYLYCNHMRSGACIMYFNRYLYEELYGLYNTDGL